MAVYGNLEGTGKTTFQISETGVKLKNNAGNLIARNATDSADSSIEGSLFLAGVGAVGTPSFTFVGNTGYGMYFVSSSVNISSNGLQSFNVTHTASAVNLIGVKSTATGATPIIQNISGDTNGIGLGIALVATAASAAGAGGPITLTAGTGNGANVGGVITITAGQGGATGNGAVATITGGAGGATSGNAGGVTLSGGTPVNGTGGSINITASAGVSGTNAGGNVIVTAGNAAGGGTAGKITAVTSSGTEMTVGAGIFLGAATGGAQGFGTLNATNLYVNGVAVSGGGVSLSAPNTWTATQTFSTSGTGEVITATRTDAGATDFTAIGIFRDSASPVAADIIGSLLFEGRDSGANRQTYAEIQAVIDDPTNTSEDSHLNLQTITAGTLSTAMTIGQGIQVGTPTGGDKGVGTLNATGLFVNNVSVTPSISYGQAVAIAQFQQVY